MKNTNLYDIDGELIRKPGDNTKLTIEDARKKIEYYQEKLKELDEKDPKYAVYATYIRNLTGYCIQLLANNPEMMKEVLAAKKTTEEEAKKALKSLSEDINDDGNTNKDTEDEIPGQTPGDNESAGNEELGDDTPVGRDESNIPEDRPLTQSDLLVERDDVNTEMEQIIE